MEWKGKYKSELLMVCHMDAKAMHKVGAISDKEMKEYDRDCLVNPKAKSSTVYADNSTMNIKQVHATALLLSTIIVYKKINIRYNILIEKFNKRIKYEKSFFVVHCSPVSCSRHCGIAGR